MRLRFPKHLTFVTPPGCDGPEAEVAFAADERGIWRRTHTLDDDLTRFEVALWEDLPAGAWRLVSTLRGCR